MASFVSLNTTEYCNLFSPLFPTSLIGEANEDEQIMMLGIEEEGYAVGSCALLMTVPEIEILWFYLDPQFRGRGIGIDAFMQLCEMMKEDFGASIIKMDVFADSDPKLKRLFEGLPAVYEKLPECRLETTIGRIRFSERLKGRSKNSVPLSDVSQQKINVLCEKLIEAQEDLIQMPIVIDDYMKEMSAVYMENDEPAGILLVSKDKEKLEIPYMASLSSDSMALMDMVLFVKEKTARIGEDTALIMNLVNEKLKKLIMLIADSDDEEEYGFVHNERITLDLGYIDEMHEAYEDMLAAWKELEDIKGAVKLWAAG